MKRFAIALALVLPASTAFASGDGVVSAEMQTQIRTLLSEKGYEVRSIEMEDGMYEAYALRDGNRYEVYIDRDMRIVRTEMDD
ncbi:PepSY domain-containing protein [Rhodobacteraceae bacterium W635]|uniref:PepSY domain-containing protein n=1 Tax=Nioella halotolerans TaxID=2303578 RepID=UPI000E3EB8D5|nr:PepSY domain-containing protein [Rhodobacteraceae bacterium W635]